MGGGFAGVVSVFRAIAQVAQVFRKPDRNPQRAAEAKKAFNDGLANLEENLERLKNDRRLSADQAVDGNGAELGSMAAQALEDLRNLRDDVASGSPLGGFATDLDGMMRNAEDLMNSHKERFLENFERAFRLANLRTNAPELDEMPDEEVLAGEADPQVQ